jgi:hypothetical protein
LPFEELINFLGSLAQSELTPNRPAWQNYLASLGITAVSTCRSIQVLVRADSTEGIAMLTRELFQLATRFINCIDNTEVALLQGIHQEMKQLKTIGDAQGKHTLALVDTRIRQCCELLQRLHADDSKMQKEPESGTLVGDLGVPIYKWLCLDAHNRPGAILAKHGEHIDQDRLTPFGAVSAEQVDQYLRFAAYAVGAICRHYLASTVNFVSSEREQHIEHLEGLLLPLAIEQNNSPSESALHEFARK